MAEDVKVALCIYDYEGDFRELTGQLGIEPTKTVKKGDPLLSNPPANITAGFAPRSRWEFTLELPQASDPSDALTGLLERLAPCSDQLAVVAEQYHSVISVGFHIKSQNSEITLDPDILSIISDMKVRLWFDIYA